MLPPAAGDEEIYALDASAVGDGLYKSWIEPDCEQSGNVFPHA